jgi:hypothetical protein
MKLVKCIKERNTGDYEIGRKYWMDETKTFVDDDGDTYVEMYKDPEKRDLYGRRLLSRFEVVEEKCEQIEK